MDYDKLTKAQLLQKVEELEAQVNRLEASTFPYYFNSVRTELLHLRNDLSWLINRTYLLGGRFREALVTVEIPPLIKT